MADFKTPLDLIDNIGRDLKSLGDDVEKELGSEMLDIGAGIIAGEWKRSISRHKHIDTGEMKKSVAPKKGKKTGNLREIYPQGADSKGVRNAEKAFIAHYGKSGQPGTHFVDEAEENSMLKCVDAMQRKLDKYIEKKGM